MISLQVAVLGLAVVQACHAEVVCDNYDDEMCRSPPKATAMLQVSAKAHNFKKLEGTGSSPQGMQVSDDKPKCEQVPAFIETHLEQARLCLPQGLPEKHLSALRRQASLLTSKARRTAETQGAHRANETGVTDTSLPLRTGDVIRLLNVDHGTRVGWWGSNGHDFNAQCPLAGVAHAILGYENTPARTEVQVEVDGAHTYFMQGGHGSYMGICTDSSGSCGSDTGLASVNGFSSKVDATKFGVEEAGDVVYLKGKLSERYLGVDCVAPFSTSGAAHNIFGFSDAGTALLQQGEKQAAAPSRARFSVEFISRTTTTTTTTLPVDGASASLDAAGFEAVTAMCCPQEMETFFGRLLAQMGLDVCSKPHVQGLMHWFSCVPDMDYQYLIDTINNGNPCKYWTAAGTTCPELSPDCQGEWCR